MVDERIVATKLEQIEQYHGELRAKQESLSRSEFLDDTTQQRAVERMFENAIQACADLAQHIATAEFGYDGSSTKGAIEVLSVRDVITDETEATLVQAAGFRNILAHEYGRVDGAEVFEVLQTGLTVYDLFGQQVAQWVHDRA